ncbi:MAG: hypothetical protein M1118_09150 [Chloroflexi bacterium]|nr:hypothetical protein [Chloroflexota bacterium]
MARLGDEDRSGFRQRRIERSVEQLAEGLQLYRRIETMFFVDTAAEVAGQRQIILEGPAHESDVGIVVEQTRR